MTHVPAPPHGARWAVRRMQHRDLDAVAAVESVVYPFPWTRGNFVDSLDSGYDAWVFEVDADMIGYAVLMWAPQEVHLLNISVVQELQGRGLGRAILRCLCADARLRGAGSMLLEVRPSNTVARSLYESAGFVQVGLRKHYYPAGPGAREDALVMRRELDGVWHEQGAV